MPAQHLAELQSLLDLLCESRIQPEGLERLQQLVVARHDALEYYRNYVRLHGLLRASAATLDLGVAGLSAAPSPAFAAGHGGADSAPTSAGPTVLGFLGAAANLSASWLTSPKAIGLTVVGGLLSYFVVLVVSIAISRTRWVEHDLEPGSLSAVHAPARVIGTTGARWQDRPLGIALGAQLPSSPSHLAAGIVQIEFAGGARVCIEGPAMFVPKSGQCLELSQGKLMAAVPARARGFTVVTPSAKVVDLGTEFGVEVDSRGDTDLHVIKGHVAITQTGQNAAATRPGRSVRAGEAVRVALGGQTAASIPLDRTRFEFARDLHAVASAATQTRAGEAQYQPVWLGNLFDDLPHVPLAAAMRTDTFGAVADLNDLGVDRVLYGGEPIKEIAPDLRFDLTSAGWTEPGGLHLVVTNDAWTHDPGSHDAGIRLRGEKMELTAGRIEEGIGAHANALVTFNLDDIRKAGRLPKQHLQFVCDRAGINDASMGGPGSIHMVVLVSSPAEVQTALVDGKTAELTQQNGHWTISSPLGEPISADGRYVSFQVTLGNTAKYLTLITTSADDDSWGDAGVWVGARLETAP